MHRFGYAPPLVCITLASMKSGLKSDPQQWTDERQQRGLAGEQQAIRYLESRGWTIVAHRFRAGRAEIDVVARRGHLVAFVEVKVRRGGGVGTPLLGVPPAQRRGQVRGARG